MYSQDPDGPRLLMWPCRALPPLLIGVSLPNTFALLEADGKAGESHQSTGDGCQTNHCGAPPRASGKRTVAPLRTNLSQRAPPARSPRTRERPTTARKATCPRSRKQQTKGTLRIARDRSAASGSRALLQPEAGGCMSSGASLRRAVGYFGGSAQDSYDDETIAAPQEFRRPP